MYYVFLYAGYFYFLFFKRHFSAVIFSIFVSAKIRLVCLGIKYDRKENKQSKHNPCQQRNSIPHNILPFSQTLQPPLRSVPLLPSMTNQCMITSFRLWKHQRIQQNVYITTIYLHNRMIFGNKTKQLWIKCGWKDSQTEFGEEREKTSVSRAKKPQPANFSAIKFQNYHFSLPPLHCYRLRNALLPCGNYFF